MRKSLRSLPGATILTVLSLSLLSCSSTPGGVIPPEEMSHLLADLFIGESVIENNSKTFREDSVKREFLQSVYMRHGVTPEEVDSSFMWYGKHMELYTEVYDRTITILEERLNSASLDTHSSSESSGVSLEGDSVDVWPSVRYSKFYACAPSEIIPFFLASDRYWEKGDTYTLAFKTVGDAPGTHVTVAAEYYDGTTDYVTSTSSGEGWQRVTLVLDSTRSASNVFGSISQPLSPESNSVTFIDSISLYRTRWEGNASSALRKRQSSVKIR